MKSDLQYFRKITLRYISIALMMKHTAYVKMCDYLGRLSLLQRFEVFLSHLLGFERLLVNSFVS